MRESCENRAKTGLKFIQFEKCFDFQMNDESTCKPKQIICMSEQRGEIK